MASSSEPGIFQKMLIEEYMKRPKVDVVGIKRRNFEDMIFKAHEHIKSKNFLEAKQSYFDIIDYVRNDPYPDELNLSSDIEYCVKCCYCYSCLMNSPSPEELNMESCLADLIEELAEYYSNRLLPKYLQVLFFFQREEWALALHWCNMIEVHEEDEIERLLTVDTTMSLVPSETDLIAEAEVYAEKSFFNCWKNLAKTRLAKSENEQHEVFLKQIGSILINKLLNVKIPPSEVDLHKIFHHDILPLWCKNKKGKMDNFYYDEKFLPQCNECIRAKVRHILKNNPKLHGKETVENLVLRLAEKMYAGNLTEPVEDSLFNKIEMEDRMTQENNSAKEDIKHSIGQTQTDKIKYGNRCVQTEGTKCKSVEVQVNLDSQVLNTVLDIKNKVLVSQEKKDETITKLTKKVNELNDKLTKEINRKVSAEEEFQKKITRQEFEIKKLKEQLIQCDTERKQEHDKNVSLQKILVEQISDKFNVQKNVYKMFERKSLFMIMYLKEINQFLTPNSIPNNSVVNQNINVWETHLKSNKQNLDQLNNFYKKVKVDMINSDKFNMTWPEIPELPRDEDNIVFISFKPAIKNIIDIEEKLLKKFNANQGPAQHSTHIAQNIQYNVQPTQFPIHNSSFFVGPRIVYPNPQNHSAKALPHTLPQPCSTFNRERMPFDPYLQRQQSQAEQRPKQNQILKISKSTESLNKASGKEVTISPENDTRNEGLSACATSSIKRTERDNRNYQEKEKILFQYVSENCPGATEDDVTLAMLDVMNENKGTLAKLSKEKIVEDVKIVLRTKKQPAWVAPKPPHVNWQNDQSERSCTICFEEFSFDNIYTLPCQHQYHKECIKRWLKTSSVCPICRVHSVIDEDFPPLH